MVANALAHASYSVEIFKLMPEWDKCINVLGELCWWAAMLQCSKLTTFFIGPFV
jgi:hypothetical protein